jgi:hypothetical protein
MGKLNQQKTALTLGLLFSGVHVAWGLLVLIGLAQPLMDFIFWAHMVANPYQVTGFTLTQALVLVVVTFGTGFIGGWVFSWIWNRLVK